MDTLNKYVKNHLLYIVFVIIFFPFITDCCAEVQYIGTYSNFEYNEEGGDLLGAELRIVWTNNGYQCTFQLSEGEPGDLFLARPIIKKNRIAFRIEKLKGKFEGKISKTGVRGVLRYDSGGELTLYLERKQDPLNSFSYSKKRKLIERIQIYYKYEKIKDWANAYQFRPPAFREVVAFNTYQRIMRRDSRNWQLLQAKLVDIKIKDKIAQAKIIFVDKFPKGYFPKSTRSTAIKIIEITFWEKIKGIWYVKNPGGRSYLTLNMDLVEN